MISSLSWVPRGVAKATPDVAQPTEEELAATRQELLSIGKADLDDEVSGSESDEMEAEGHQQAIQHAEAAAAAISSSAGRKVSRLSSSHAVDGISAAMKDLDMEHYDDSDDENIVARVLGGRGDAALDEDGDPYITLGGEEEDDSEDEDFIIKPTDLLILAARNEDDVSNLEVWVYEEADEAGEGNLYVHHDIILPAFPLCISWLDCNPDGSAERSNMAAVGSMEPGIEVWNLDVVDAVEPAATLGGEQLKGAPTALEPSANDSSVKKAAKKKKKGKVKGPALKEGSHEDSVLGLSWNQQYRNVLASASADKTVKVWDITRQACEHTMRHHSGKVQAVAWNPAEAHVLLTGSYDKTACLVDVRSPSGQLPTWTVSADVEALTWHPHQPTCFVVSSEDGIVACYDARKGSGSDAIFRLSAHDAPTCTMSFSTSAPGLLATGSTDKKVKLWDVSNNQPSLIASKDLQIGAVFSVSFSGQAGYLLACGGAMDSLTVWDMRSLKSATQKWPELKKMGLRPDAVPEQDEED
ncbi:hypothetical protein CEUSTIGMA_g13159.t1 [Chlamydomonas eustigma]|uniref:Uncharacterized protein n=1 Tax=Chlamydomonas eustigma TaxID=1157962 RepID=A0A250XRR1_9CHLO|nr:hypothetical protein CEUSTIGMA_g13159.t1 [Chlamydomonas eustigma]|eukprot:GAX85744.1 hypothetical protein CEUSTIGMA_g13159.t1 [Chlamydomonas eustigma]